jgi:septum formation protein
MMRLVLASGSPRRRTLLRGAGYEPEVFESDIDDARLLRGRVGPEAFVMALAWFKARRVLDRFADRLADGDALLVAADTICVHGDALLGKPRDADEARSMLRGMRGVDHRVVTGVAALPLPFGRGERLIFVDVSTVALGELDDDEIDRYVASGAWQGKAGGYNYAERVAAGWPVRCEGDPTGVMGLPMRRVLPLLASLGALPTAVSQQGYQQGFQQGSGLSA